MPSTLFRNATILTMNDRLELVSGAVAVRDGHIVSVGAEPAGTHDVIHAVTMHAVEIRSYNLRPGNAMRSIA